jgi:hypothetical protein
MEAGDAFGEKPRRGWRRLKQRKDAGVAVWVCTPQEQEESDDVVAVLRAEGIPAELRAFGSGFAVFAGRDDEARARAALRAAYPDEHEFAHEDQSALTWAVSALESEAEAEQVAAILTGSGIANEVRRYVKNAAARGLRLPEGSYASGDLGPRILFGVAIRRSDAERAAHALSTTAPDEEELARESEEAYRRITGREP